MMFDIGPPTREFLAKAGRFIWKVFWRVVAPTSTLYLLTSDNGTQRTIGLAIFILWINYWFMRLEVVTSTTVRKKKQAFELEDYKQKLDEMRTDPTQGW